MKTEFAVPSLAEHRKLPRFDQDLKVTISDLIRPEKFPALVRNLSERGLCVQAEAPLAVGEPFHFKLDLPSEERISGIAHCVWSREERGEFLSGGEIRSMAMPDARRMHQYVRSLFKAEPIEYRVATTRWEREEAYRLLYRCYLRRGYIAPHPSGIRYSPRMAEPETITFIALSKGVVIATMSLFMDGQDGLPLDDVFKPEVDALRAQGRKVIEVGALAHRREDPHRGIEVFMTLARMCSVYALKSAATDSLITVNPRHADIYSRLMKYELFVPERPHPSVRNAPALCYRLTRENLSPQTHRWFFNGGPIPEVPDAAPEFSAEDKAYFNGLACEHELIASGR